MPERGEVLQWATAQTGITGSIMRYRIPLIGVAAFLCMPLLTPAQTVNDPPSLAAGEVRALLATMKAGGYVLYFRHLETRHDQEDRQPVDLNDCAAQRNLSADGRQNGVVIGRQFLASGLRFSEVLASPFCRTRDTARLLAGRERADADLFFAIALPDNARREKGQRLRALLAKPPAPGTNTLIVGHTANLQEAVGLWPKPEGVAYVFKPGRTGELNPVARIAPEVWKQLEAGSQ